MLTDRFVKAVRYANRAHHRQLRKGTAVPYVSHLLGVAAHVIDDGGSEDEAIAALLHDVVKDQGGLRRLADVRRRFGAHVAAIVRGLHRRHNQAQAAVAGREGRIHPTLENRDRRHLTGGGGRQIV